MSEEKETIDFQLSKVLPYSLEGNMAETACITMRAPRMSEFNESASFSQIVTQAFMDTQKWASGNKEDVDKEKKKDEAMTAGAVRVMLYASDRPIKEISKRFVELASRNGVCVLDDKGTTVKASLMEKMEIEDFITLMCTYISVFIYPSLFNAMEEEGDKESQKQSGAPSEAT